MDENKKKFVSWIGYMLIAIGGMMAISTSTSGIEHTQAENTILIVMEMVFLLPGIFIEIWVNFLSNKEPREENTRA